MLFTRNKAAFQLKLKFYGKYMYVASYDYMFLLRSGHKMVAVTIADLSTNCICTNVAEEQLHFKKRAACRPCRG